MIRPAAILPLRALIVTLSLLAPSLSWADGHWGFDANMSSGATPPGTCTAGGMTRTDYDNNFNTVHFSYNGDFATPLQAATAMASGCEPSASYSAAGDIVLYTQNPDGTYNAYQNISCTGTVGAWHCPGGQAHSHDYTVHTCVDGSHVPDASQCPTPVTCPDGSHVESMDDCPSNEATCANRGGTMFTNPDALFAAHGDGYSSEGQKGWLYGCEFQELKCANGVCQGCFNGNGTVRMGGSNPIRWSGELNAGTPPSSCEAVDNPQPHPGFCEPTDPHYNARTDSCEGSPVIVNCDDPTYNHTDPCNLTDLPPSGTPVYNPPAGTTPPLTPEQFNNPPPATPVTTTPPVNTGHEPGYTGGNPDGTPTTVGHGNGSPTTTVNPGSTGGSGTASTTDTGSVSWGALPTIPTDGFYTRQFEGGLSGVFTDRMAQMQDTPLFTFANQFRIANGIGTAPVWHLDFSSVGLGVHDLKLFDSDNSWAIIRLVILLSTFFACRRIIFGG